jgi:hypothetical protein
VPPVLSLPPSGMELLTLIRQSGDAGIATTRCRVRLQPDWGGGTRVSLEVVRTHAFRDDRDLGSVAPGSVRLKPDPTILKDAFCRIRANVSYRLASWPAGSTAIKPTSASRICRSDASGSRARRASSSCGTTRHPRGSSSSVHRPIPDGAAGPCAAAADRDPCARSDGRNSPSCTYLYHAGHLLTRHPEPT